MVHRTWTCANQVGRVLIGCPSRRRGVVAARLALIYLWQGLIIQYALAVLPLNSLYGVAWDIWGRYGEPDDFSTALGVTFLVVPLSLIMRVRLVMAGFAWMLLFGSLPFLLFRMARRPKPYLYRFVRFWWLACLYGTIAVPACVVAMTVFLVPWLIPHFILVYALCAPVIHARIEWHRRLRPVIARCLCCGYNLTGLTKPRCPECGLGFPP